jgi:hypothetical protein
MIDFFNLNLQLHGFKEIPVDPDVSARVAALLAVLPYPESVFDFTPKNMGKTKVINLDKSRCKRATLV